MRRLHNRLSCKNVKANDDENLIIVRMRCALHRYAGLVESSFINHNVDRKYCAASPVIAALQMNIGGVEPDASMSLTA